MLAARSLTTNFVSELIRAANELNKLTAYEVSRLLDRSIDTIGDMREQTGVAGSHSAKDVLIDFREPLSALATFPRKRSGMPSSMPLM